MINNNIQITIITLTKNNQKSLLKTTESIINQNRNFLIEWIIIDGSDKKCFLKNKTSINNRFPKEFEKQDIQVNHINAKNINLEGIYPCMNFGKKIAQGNFLIYLNSGDIFFNNFSLEILFKESLNLDLKKGLLFGQANIISPLNINWNFPGKRLEDFEKWLKIFEPNHQSMIVANSLANMYDFPLNLNVIGDGYWKRKIIDTATEIIYINKPIVKFFLDGVSSSKPSKKLIRSIIKNHNITIFRKCIFILKYLLPSRFFYFYYLSQKYKSLLVDLII